MGLKRFLKPSILLRRKALRTGVFGGDRKWLAIYLIMWVWRRLKALFGFGDPQPVLIEDIDPGQRFVVAHEDSSSSRRKRRKVEKKRAKKAAKAEGKATRKAEKVAAKATKKATKKADKRAAKKIAA